MIICPDFVHMGCMKFYTCVGVNILKSLGNIIGSIEEKLENEKQYRGSLVEKRMEEHLINTRKGGRSCNLCEVTYTLFIQRCHFLRVTYEGAI